MFKEALLIVALALLGGFLSSIACIFVYARLTKRLVTEEITITGFLFILLGFLAATLVAMTIVLITLVVTPFGQSSVPGVYFEWPLILGMLSGVLWYRHRNNLLRS